MGYYYGLGHCIIRSHKKKALIMNNVKSCLKVQIISKQMNYSPVT